MNQIRGRNFVLTGKMWTSREHIEDAIKKLGGLIETRIRYSDYLVQASGQWGRKTQKYLDAEWLSVRIIDDKQLYDMIVEANEFEKNK